MPGDYYELLGVHRDANEDEIKRAYRKLARELHPDANGGDASAAERFKEVSVAYETLRDPERRRRYDLFGAETPGAGGGPEDVFAGGLGDIFEAFFGQQGGQRSGRRGPGRGADAQAVVELAFEEAVFGGDTTVTVRVPTTCQDCAGSGARPGTTPVRCTSCGGSGEIRRVRQSILGQMVTASPCPTCHGLGEVVQSPCPACRGEGRVTEERSFTVEVPAGVDDGTTLRLTGRGAAGPRGGPPGDLYVHLRVRPHPVLRRNGADLHEQVHVGFAQAALGAEPTIQTLEGDETLRVPPGTQSGKVVRLRGRGVPHVQGRGRGDLLVEIVADTPTGLGERAEELLRAYAVEQGEQVLEPEGGLLHRLRSKLH